MWMTSAFPVFFATCIISSPNIYWKWNWSNIEWQIFCLKKLYVLRKWEQKETFCRNSLMHLFNGDRHLCFFADPWKSSQELFVVDKFSPESAHAVVARHIFQSCVLLLLVLSKFFFVHEYFWADLAAYSCGISRMVCSVLVQGGRGWEISGALRTEVKIGLMARMLNEERSVTTNWEK